MSFFQCKYAFSNENMTFYINKRKSLKDLDMETLDERREKLCLKFAKRCLRNEKTIKNFPENSKNHVMKTRKQEKYQVQYANTKRFKESALIYMQNLLNQQEK